MAKNLIDYKRIRHINVSYYFVRELIINGTLTFSYISIKDIITDDLIKALIPAKFDDFIEILGLKNGELEEDH